MIYGISLRGKLGHLSRQVRPIDKLAPHLHKIHAIVFQVTYFVEGVHIMDPKYLHVHS